MRPAVRRAPHGGTWRGGVSGAAAPDASSPRPPRRTRGGGGSRPRRSGRRSSGAKRSSRTARCVACLHRDAPCRACDRDWRRRGGNLPTARGTGSAGGARRWVGGGAACGGCRPGSMTRASSRGSPPGDCMDCRAWRQPLLRHSPPSLAASPDGRSAMPARHRAIRNSSSRWRWPKWSGRRLRSGHCCCCIDDAHRLDAASLRLLPRLLRATNDLPVMVLLGASSDVMRDELDELRRLVGQVPGTAVTIGALPTRALRRARRNPAADLQRCRARPPGAPGLHRLGWTGTAGRGDPPRGEPRTRARRRRQGVAGHGADARPDAARPTCPMRSSRRSGSMRSGG